MKLVNRSLVLSVGVGVVGALFLVGIYVGITLLGSSDPLAHVWENRVTVLSIATGFGIQLGMFAFMRQGRVTPLQLLTGRATTGASGSASTVAMVACCVAALTNLLPLLGLTALTSLLANWKMPFMIAGFGANLLGIGIMGFTMIKQRKRTRIPAMQMAQAQTNG